MRPNERPLRRRRPALALGLVAVLALMGTTASAVQAVADLRVEGPFLLEGARLTSLDATLRLFPPEGPEPSLVLLVEDGTLRIVHSDITGLENPRRPGEGDVWLADEKREEVVPLRGARVVVRDAGADFFGLLAAGPEAMALDLGRASRLVQFDPRPHRFQIGFGNDSEYVYTRDVRAHAFRLGWQGGEAPALGPLRGAEAAFIGARLDAELPDGLRTWELRERIEALAPVGGARAYRNLTSYAVLDVGAGSAILAPAVGGELYTRAFRLDLQGRALLTEATGRVAAGEGRIEAERESVEVHGRFAAVGLGWGTPAPLLAREQGGGRLRIEGDATLVAVGGRTLATEPGVAGPLGLGTLLALAAAWATGLLGKAAGLVGAPLYAHLPPGTMLHHERRRAIYAAVLSTPGLHLRQLQRATGMRWGALQYHTAMLVGAGLLREERVGKHTLLFSDRHRVDAASAKALHLLRLPSARRMAEVLLGGPATEARVAAAAGVSPRLANRYLRQMAALQLVEARQSRPRTYRALPALAVLMGRVGGEPVTARPPAPPEVPAPQPPGSMPPAGVYVPAAGHAFWSRGP